MAIINVTTTVDENNSTGNISLREAVIQANGSAGDDTIVLEANQTYTLTRRGTFEEASATGNLNILSGGGKLTILASTVSGTATINGGGIDGVFEVKSGANLTLQNLTIKGGKPPVFGGGIDNSGNLSINNSTISYNSASLGGGIDNSGNLSISNSTISYNSSNFGSGGINNTGTLSISNSTISYNSSASSIGGGGITNYVGTISISNSTISSNTADFGGGILNDAGTMSISNSTISSNYARFNGGGLANNINSNLSINNSIIAQNHQNKDVKIDSLKSVNSQGYNLIGNGAGVEQIFNKTGDMIGTATNPLNAKLGPLQNNGGLTKTHALLAGSPAINKGKTTLTKDQRGYNRNGVADIGAYEYWETAYPTTGADKIIGTAGADIIDGLAGNDTISGLGGNDKLTGGDGRDYLDGGAGTDTLIGAGGNDVFLVNSGNDRLSGGTGSDKFTYDTKAIFAKTAVGVDTITDFVISQNDKIVLDKDTFPKITSVNGTGFSINAEFAKVNTDTKAAISGADIVYNTATGELFYNQNGTATGFGTGGKFAILSNQPNLTENQFIIQA